MQKNHRASPTEGQLRRNILETVIRGQEQTQLTQAELDVQGKKLKASVKDAEVIANQTIKTGKAVDNLLFETSKSTTLTQRILRCCRSWCCCCCCCCRCCCSRDRDTAVTLPPITVEEDEEQDDSLKNFEIQTKMQRRKSSWKKTLAATPSDNIWFRQIDTSLSQLQLAAEEMSESLDEQLRLAQILTIYINYGVDKVLDVNKNLL